MVNNYVIVLKQSVSENCVSCFKLVIFIILCDFMVFLFSIIIFLRILYVLLIVFDIPLLFISLFALH